MNPAQSQKFFKIGEAAKKLGLSSETLRRWEKAGKISFSRTPGGKRLFSEADLDAVRRLLEPTHEYTQTSTSHSIAPIARQSERVTLSISIPKLSFPKASFAKIAIIGLVLALISGNIFFFSQTPYFHPVAENVASGADQAVLGVETFVAPALIEAEIFIQNILVKVREPISRLGSLLRSLAAAIRSSPLIVALFGPVDQEERARTIYSSLPQGIRVEGNNIYLGFGNVGTTIVNNNFEVLGSSTVQSLNVQGTLTVSGPIIFNDLSSTTFNTTSSVSIGGNLTVSGTINGNTFTSTKLVFSGSSPSIYPSTTNTGISLNANGTGAINIGNSGTGDVYIAGGSGDGGCTITNSTGTLNCSSNITSAGDLIANGGDILTDQSILRIGSSSTTISIPGTLTITKAPTQPHTGTWAIDSSTWNVSDATFYINPASATADSNLLGVAVGGNVKFDVDAEGDIYGRNLILTGNTTTGTTTVSGDLVVEGNTTLGDAITDTITLNAAITSATVSFSGGNKTLDITGAATRTLTLLNSTSSQIADLDLSDGNLKLAGTTIITNAGAGSFVGNINSSSGSLQTNGVTRIDNSGNLTAGTGSFGGNLTPSLDNTYDFGSASLRWKDAYFAGDVTAGDLVFKNNFRFTENGETGMNILNPKGEVIGGFDDQGNLWMKGEIKQRVQ